MSARAVYSCDCCGASASGPAVDPQLPEGWISGGGILRGPHLCPRCAREFQASQPPVPRLLAPDWRHGDPVLARLTVKEWLKKRVGMRSQ